MDSLLIHTCSILRLEYQETRNAYGKPESSWVPVEPAVPCRIDVDNRDQRQYDQQAVGDLPARQITIVIQATVTLDRDTEYRVTVAAGEWAGTYNLVEFEPAEDQYGLHHYEGVLQKVIG